MNVILRYLFVKNLLVLRKTKPDDKWFKVNLVGLFLGILSAFGLSMVANFQVLLLLLFSQVLAGFKKGFCFKFAFSKSYRKR